jgi:hypothetical protein
MDQFYQTEIFPGATAVFAGSAVLSLIVSLVGTLVVIRVFRARVAQSMAAAAGVAPDNQALEDPVRAPEERLTIEVIDANRGRSALARSKGPIAKARRMEWTTAAIFAAAACWHPLLLSAAMITGFGLVNRDSALMNAALTCGIMFLVTATPVALAPMLVTGARLRNLALACLGLVGLLWAWDQFFGEAVYLWLLVAATPTGIFLLLSALGHRVIGPIVSAATTFVVFGHLAGAMYAGYRVWDALSPVYFLHPDLRRLSFVDGVFRLLVLPLAEQRAIFSGLLTDFDSVLYVENKFELFSLPGLTTVGILLGATTAGAVLAWVFLRWLASSYRERRVSDQMLTVDVMMVVFTIYTVATTAGVLEWGPAAALAAFFAYKITSGVFFRFRRRSQPNDTPQMLLFLRVFGFDRRTQKLLQDVGHRWRRIGPIRLIAGTDLVNATIEPHEFFSFMSGQLSRAFVKDRQDALGRLSESPVEADPDGLYRVEDYFCHADTWRIAVSVLARASDAILIDLRGFTVDNQGCVFELECLVASAPLNRIVLLVDHSTDVGAVEGVLRRAWSAMPENSPNQGAGPKRVRFLLASADPRQTRDSVLGLLCETIGQAPVPSVSAAAPSSPSNVIA